MNVSTVQCSTRIGSLPEPNHFSFPSDLKRVPRAPTAVIGVAEWLVCNKLCYVLALSQPSSRDWFGVAPITISPFPALCVCPIL